MHEPTAATRIAVECLTLWLQPGAEAWVAAAEHMVELMGTPINATSIDMVSGLLNLNVWVLFDLMKERGLSLHEADAGVARYLQDLSARLPE